MPRTSVAVGWAVSAPLKFGPDSTLSFTTPSQAGETAHPFGELKRFISAGTQRRLSPSHPDGA